MRGFVCLLLPLVALAGCADDRDTPENVSLSYGGDADGSHDDTLRCGDGDARLTGAGNLQSGRVEATVTDGAGAQQFSRTFDDQWEAEAEEMGGAGGQWTLHATRSGGFQGSYTLHLVCT